MSEPFFSRKNKLGITNALLLLMLVSFIVPFVMRGARMALQKTENNIKDWLPDSFRETEELAWFAKHFVSEQFVLATWQGCTADDQKLKLFVDKLRSEQAVSADRPDDDFKRARQLGTDYALMAGDDFFYDWGGEKEKWLVDESGRWFYVTPPGKLYRWEGKSSVVGVLYRNFQKLLGSFRLDGQFIASFGGTFGEGEKNPFYRDPRLLTAPLFSRIQTGPDLVEELAGEGGPLHRTGNAMGGKREALDRLTGTLFAPVVPYGFDWTSESIRKHLSGELVGQFPKGWEDKLQMLIDETVQEKCGGSKEAFLKADPKVHSALWYSFFDAMAIAEPPRQTCVLITLTDVGRRNLKQVLGRGMLGSPLGRILVLADQSGISPPPTPTTLPPPFSWMVPEKPLASALLRMGGPPVDNVAIDEEGTITLVRLVGYSVALGLILSWFCLRSINQTLMVFFVGGVGAVSSLSIVWWSNATIDAILLTMPSLVYVLGMAESMHIINYYRDVVREEGPVGAPEKALKHAFFPCLLANLTTAFGLLSLCTSEIAPIRKFGIFSAMAVMFTTLLIYLYIPSALSTFMTMPAGPQKKDGKHKPEKEEESFGIMDAFWQALGGWVIRNRGLVNVTGILLVVMFTVGLFRMNTSVHLLKMFDRDAQIIQDYRWLEQNFGRLVPMELVVRFPTGVQRSQIAGTQATQESDTLTVEQARRRLSLLERAEAVAKIQHIVEREFGYAGSNVLGQGMSALTLLRDLPDPSSGFAANRIVFDGLLKDSFDRLSKTDYLRYEKDGPAEGTELWRISLRLGALNNVDYGGFISKLRLAVEPVMAAYDCRVRVIDSILEQTASTPERRVGTVLILGSANPKAKSGEPSGDEMASELEQTPVTVKQGLLKKDEVIIAPIDSNKIFAESLADLLTNESVSSFRWHDPVKSKLQLDNPEQMQKWGEYLSRFSCVVIAADHPTYDMDFIRKNQPNVFDYRETIDQIVKTASDERLSTGESVAISPNSDRPDVIYTGVVPIVYKAQRTLLNSLIESTAWAFLTIFPVMAIILIPAVGFRNNLKLHALCKMTAAGFVAMLPNQFPIIIIFGAMGFLGTEIDIGSMMTASIALGIAVDDTIHFLSWFRSAAKMGLSRLECVMYAYRRCAPAMTQTTLVGGLGLSVFALSTFTPTQRFGTLMLTILSIAVLGDLIFLPALLASPLGKLFMPYPGKGTGPEDHDKPAIDADSLPLVEHDLPHYSEQATTAASDVKSVDRDVGASPPPSKSSSDSPNEQDIQVKAEQDGSRPRPHLRRRADAIVRVDPDVIDRNRDSQ
jgi:predicted RND superfamily exporter protein